VHLVAFRATGFLALVAASAVAIASASAQTVIYRHSVSGDLGGMVRSAGAGSPSGGGPGGSGTPTAGDCYDPANVGVEGQPGWTGCEGMLIVDDSMLRGAASSRVGGDESFACPLNLLG
jgi:hypothetical protein